MKSAMIYFTFQTAGFLGLFLLQSITGLIHLSKTETTPEEKKLFTEAMSVSDLLWINIKVLMFYLVASGLCYLVCQLVFSSLHYFKNLWRKLIFGFFYIGLNVFLFYFFLAVYQPGIAQLFIAKGVAPISESFFNIRLLADPEATMNSLKLIFALQGIVLIGLFISQLMKTRWLQQLTAVLLVVVLFMQVYQQRPIVKNDRNLKPNIIFLAIDSLRTDHTKFGGYSRPTTPNLDNYFAQSVLFEKMYTSSARTDPSWATILTGRYSYAHNIYTSFPPPERWQIQVPTLPKILQQQGYISSIVSDFAGTSFEHIDFGFNNKSVPVSLGFLHELEAQIFQMHFLIPSFLFGYLSDVLLPEFYLSANTADTGRLSRRIEREVVRLQHAGQPFFMIGFYSQAHHPYQSKFPHYMKFSDQSYMGPNKYAFFEDYKKTMQNMHPRTDRDRQQIVALYDQSIADVDESVGDLLRRLKSRGALQNTLIVFLSDHGETLMEEVSLPGHGVRLEESEADNKMFFAIYLDSQIVPRLSPQKVNRVSSATDILPTVLSLIGIKTDLQMDGVDLTTQVEPDGRILIKDRPVFLETDFSLDSSYDMAAVGALQYPKFESFVKIHDSPTKMVYLPQEIESEIRRAKWRKILFQGSSLTYIPKKRGPAFIYRNEFGAEISGRTDTLDLKNKLLKHIERESDVTIEPSGLISIHTGR